MKKILWAFQKWFSDVLGTRQYFRYLEKEDRRRRIAGQFLTFITLVLGVWYLLWHWLHINWEMAGYSFIFFLSETVGLVLFSFFAFNAWFLRYHSPQGIPVERTFSVDIFLPVAGEPIGIFEEVLKAAVHIDYDEKTVYILDDKDDPRYQALAEKYNCGYFARPEHHDAKGGNLNYAFFRTDGDLILAIDADQVPQPQIIKTLIGYFKIPQIAFVQSKQDFKVPLGDPFGNTDRVFYNVMQSGKDTDNAAFSCGSGVMYRRKALEEIGGFSTWNIVEDVHTSMLLHDQGWRSVYYNYPMTKGTAPDDIYGVYGQRKQWAADSLRILFWDDPMRRKGLTFKQKLQYFQLGFVYLVSAFIMPIFLITPSWALLTQQFVLSAPIPDAVLRRLPYFIAMSLAYGMINYPTPYMKAFQMWTGLFPVFMRATWIALRSRTKKPEYKVNVKPTGKRKVRNPWVAVLPQLGIIFISFFAPVYIFIVGGIAWDFYLLNLVWCFWSIWTMSGISFAAIGKHKWPEEAASEEPNAPLFWSRTRELFVTVAVAIAITIFFNIADFAKVERTLNSVRIKVLRSVGLDRFTEVIYHDAPRPILDRWMMIG